MIGFSKNGFCTFLYDCFAPQHLINPHKITSVSGFIDQQENFEKIVYGWRGLEFRIKPKVFHNFSSLVTEIDGWMFLTFTFLKFSEDKDKHIPIGLPPTA